MSTLRENLEAEIQFWQDLIRASGSSLNADERKRMEHAKLFAQMKLLKSEYESAKPVSKPPRH